MMEDLDASDFIREFYSKKIYPLVGIYLPPTNPLGRIVKKVFLADKLDYLVPIKQQEA
jgi:hypothetical protein